MEKFDRNNPNWNDDYSWNFGFLRYAENHLNNLREVRGYLYLRDVYEYLGLPCNLKIIREKRLNDILWTKNEVLELGITRHEDNSIDLRFLNGVNYV